MARCNLFCKHRKNLTGLFLSARKPSAVWGEFFQRPFSGGIPIPTLAVGETTRAAANRLAALAVAAESPGDSDSLLRLPCLQADSIAGKNIAVVGGKSNLPNSLSPTLCSELQKRGARVVAAAVYRRLPPPPRPMLPNVFAMELCRRRRLTAAKPRRICWRWSAAARAFLKNFRCL